MFTTMDVYDAALSIGRECQLIVDEYGDDVLRDLMPKIVYILEELEACTSYCDKEKEEIARLQTVADELRNDQKSDIILKDKYDKSLEQLEQSWYCESQKLLQEITELEQENVRLTHQLISSCHKEVREQEDPNVIRNCVTCDKSDIICPTPHHSKVGAFLLATAKLGLEGVSANFDMDKIYDKLKNKHNEEELSNMMSSLLLETEERIQLTEQENRAADLQLVQQLKECVAINYKTARQIRRELTEVGASLDASNACESILQLPAGQGLESINFEQESNTTNKYISVEELRYLLHERNELKCRLIELEEELRLLELENQKDPEVEGPMLPEPPEKLRPNWENRLTIKMIFQNLLHHLTERATTMLS